MAVYNPDIPLTFVHIPKTAGSSVSNWLKTYTNSSDFLPKTWNSKHWQYDKVALHMKRARLDPGLVVVVVRNPWDRLLSMWSYFYGNRNEHGKFKNPPINYGSPKKLKGLVEGFSGRKQYHAMSFREFVLESDWSAARYAQTEFFPENALILRYENLAQDFKQIQDMFDARNHPLPWINASQHDPYTSMYDEEMIEEVRRRASADIDFLGYEYGNTLP